MHEWKFPTLTFEKNLCDFTAEMLAVVKKDYEDCNRYNDDLKKSLIESKKGLLVTASLLFGGNNSSVVKYLEKQRINSPSRFYFSDFERKVKNAKAQKEIESIKIEKKRKKTQATEKAIVWLTEYGQTLGIDFTINGAISLANGIAFKEEVESRTQEIKRSDKFIRFQGDENCEDDCRGWNGESNRCECGSHKVKWESNNFDDFFLNPSIFGQAQQ